LIICNYLLGQRQGSDLQGAGEGAKDAADTKKVTMLKGSMGERINKALAKVEEKKRKRAARQAQVSQMMLPGD